MSFRLDSNKVGTDVFYFDYYPIDIHRGTFTFTFAGQENRPNVLFEGIKYTVKQLYLSAAVHKLDGVDFDAELILEHAPITTGYKPLYVCIPLKRTDRQTALDQIGHADFSLDLNSMIRSYGQSCIVYDSPGYLYDQTVVVLATPIYTAMDLSVFPKVDLFRPTDTAYSVLHMEPIGPQLRDSTVEGFVEGMTQTAYCQPIDTVDPDVAQKADLVIPLDSNAAAGMGISGATQMASGFASYSLSVMFAAFLTPYAYRYLVLGMIRESAEFSDCQSRANRLRSVDIFLSVIAVYSVMSFIAKGVSASDGSMLVMTMFFLAWIILAGVTIQVDKALRAEDIVKHLCGNNSAKLEDLMKDVKPDLYDFFRMNFGISYVFIFGICVGISAGVFNSFHIGVLMSLVINYMLNLMYFKVRGAKNPAAGPGPGP